MTAPSVTVEDMLAARDARAARQRVLAGDHGVGGGITADRALVSVTLVTPGPDKNPPWAAAVFDAAMTAVIGALAADGPDTILHTETYDLPTGPQGYVVAATGPRAAKTRLVSAEDAHPWGRLFDLDVVVGGVPLQRSDVGATARRCLVCDGPAGPCSRSRAHGLPELFAAIEEVLA